MNVLSHQFAGYGSSANDTSLTDPGPMTGVLHLVNSFAAGGTERQAIQLANAQHETGTWNITVAVLDASGPLASALVPALRERCVSYPLERFASLTTIRQLRALARFLRHEDIRIVHTHGFDPNVFGMHAAALAGVPVRIASKRESVALRSNARRRLERIAFGLATHVLANCEAVRAELFAAGMPSRKMSVVPNGLHPDRLKDTAFELDPTHAPPRRRVALIANFHHAVKDQATLLRAAQRVVKIAPDVEFLLVGEGPGREGAEALARSLHLDRYVTFPGYCSDVASLLRQSAIGVLSSRLEGSPNVILEYMAAGLPVVATDTGGARELVEEGITGRLVPPGDDAAMAAALLELLGDPALRASMGRQGRQRAVRDFSLDAQLARVSDLYRSELTRVAATRR